MERADTPFVLIDDAGAGGQARLYRKPVEIVSTDRPEDVHVCLDRLRGAGARGLHAAGFLGYGSGHPLDPKLTRLAAPPTAGEAPLLWFGLFQEPIAVDADAWLPDPAGAWCGPPRPLLARDAYLAAAERVVEHIFAGDIYQANLTFQAEVSFAGSPAALYAGLRRRGGGRHGALLFTGDHWLLSCSPELFFTVAGGQITTRPMKGTAIRRTDPAADAAEAVALRADPKQRAENLMIVDLLRNDLARVARTGSVDVPRLFQVETYPTVHQMTSTITAVLPPDHDVVDLLAATFPCGSVTGVPKIRAMEIIADVETSARGPYTGSIGAIDPRGDAAFNVAIRTLVVADGVDRASIGLGSAIVADSQPEAEWAECLAKGVFVASDMKFDLIETMRFDPQEGLPDLERHLVRLKASADALGFAFDRHGARNELQAATFRLRDTRKVRLRLSRTGALAIETRPLPAPAVEPVTAAIAPLPLSRDDFRLRHKTSDRSFYEAARAAAADAFEVLFEDGGELIEGSFTHLFVEREGRLVTPAQALLPGVLRARLIAEGRAVEGRLTRHDLAHGFLIGNALRGLIPARLASGAADHT